MTNLQDDYDFGADLDDFDYEAYAQIEHEEWLMSADADEPGEFDCYA